MTIRNQSPGGKNIDPKGENKRWLRKKEIRT
jgi:hypothetical protein